MNASPSKARQDGAASEAAHWTIVTQVKSERVVYFTGDPAYQPAEEDWCYASSYIGALPEGMTLRNCWGWRFNGGVFRDARKPVPASTAELLVESNRKALLRLLGEKIQRVREPLAPTFSDGHELRRRKLAEAQQYLRGEQAGEFALLEAVAVARDISLLEAASLIEAKAQQCQAVMLETERFREQLTQAIGTATSEAQLLELREWLLDKVYPALTERFKFRADHAVPPDPDAPLPEVHRVHEAARLKAQLREAINRLRSPLASDYLQNDDVRKHKLRLAQLLLNNGGVEQEGVDFSMLHAYAKARDIPLLEAAQAIASSASSAAKLLAETERTKDELLARIERLQTLRDIHGLDKAIEALSHHGAGRTH